MPALLALKEFNEKIKIYNRECLTDRSKNVTMICLKCKHKTFHKQRDFHHLKRKCKNCIRKDSLKRFKKLIKTEGYSVVSLKPSWWTIVHNKCKNTKTVPAGSLKIRGCKKCGEAKKSQKLINRQPRPEALNNIKIRGGTFIKKEVINSADKSRKNGKNLMFLTIKCANDHEFKINEYSLIKGSYCRLCSTGMAESVFRLALNTFTDYEFFSTYIKTGKDRNNKYQLDAFCPKLKLNIEVHGVQHYEYHKFFHDDYADFLKQQEHDKKKVAYLEKQGIKCYSVTDKEVTKAMREGKLKDLVITYLKKTRKKNLIPNDIGSRFLDLTLFFKNRVFADSFISIKKKYPGQNIWDLIEYKKRDRIRENRKTKSGDGYKLIQK